MPEYHYINPKLGYSFRVQVPTLTTNEQSVAWDNFRLAADHLRLTIGATEQPEQPQPQTTTVPTPDEAFTEALEQAKALLAEAKELATRHASGIALDVLTGLAKTLRNAQRTTAR